MLENKPGGCIINTTPQQHSSTLSMVHRDGFSDANTLLSTGAATRFVVISKHSVVDIGIYLTAKTLERVNDPARSP